MDSSSHESDSVIEKLEHGKDLPSRILEFELADALPSSALWQHGLSPAKVSIDQVAQARCGSDHAAAVAKKAVEWLREYEGEKVRLNHRQRRQKLEDTIRLLQSVEEDGNTLTLLARAYLYRGLLFMPKGRTIPARKIEAMEKAIHFSKDAIEKDKENAGAWVIKAKATLELKRSQPLSFQVPVDDLKKAASFICQGAISGLSDIPILIEYAKHSADKSCLKMVLGETNDWGRPFDLFLFKAKAAFFQKDESNLKDYALKAIDYAPDSFAASFWDELVDFIKELRKNNFDFWKEMALAAYEVCYHIERSMTSNIYLRWFWARQKDLYDLAFLAANPGDTVKKAQIADSIKSRPVLRYQALNELKGKIEGIGGIYEQLQEERDGLYLKRPGLEKKVERKISQKLKREEKENVLFQCAPKVSRPWIAIHFYLNEIETHEGKKGGHALIFDPDNGWKERVFDYQLLQDRFIAWQNAYTTSRNKSHTWDMLVELCCEIGRTMPFLFELPNSKEVIWIPHGFLHRLPLHAAIRDDVTHEVFLEKHSSRYLPAWHLLGPTVDGIAKLGCLVKRLDSGEKDFFEMLKKKHWDDLKEPASADDLKSVMKRNPSLITLICHGHGEILNPFKSWLELEGSKMTVLDILKFQDIPGARVFLGACESDMAPPMDHIVDEHLSLSTAFLSLESREVVAGLWDLGDRVIDRCYAQLIDSDDIALALKDWQNGKIASWKGAIGKLEKTGGNWKESEYHSIFYDLAAFRVIGVPATRKVPDK